jgi:carbon monoxide dehydrogenase subunit G
MSRIEKSISINASPEQIWDAATDPNNWADWYVGLKEVKSIVGDGSAGTTAEMTFDMSGMKMQFKHTVLEWDRPRKWVGRTEGAIDSTSTWTYEPEGEETRVSVVMDYTVPGSVLGKIADKLVIERRNAEDMEKTLQNLKKLCEG